MAEELGENNDELEFGEMLNKASKAGDKLTFEDFAIIRINTILYILYMNNHIYHKLLLHTFYSKFEDVKKCEYNLKNYDVRKICIFE